MPHWENTFEDHYKNDCQNWQNTVSGTNTQIPLGYYSEPCPPKQWYTYKYSYNTNPPLEKLYPGSIVNIPYQTPDPYAAISVSAHLQDLKDRLLKSLKSNGNPTFDNWVKGIVEKEIEETENKLKSGK